jgi:hypothetical protein
MSSGKKRAAEENQNAFPRRGDGKAQKKKDGEKKDSDGGDGVKRGTAAFSYSFHGGLLFFFG